MIVQRFNNVQLQQNIMSLENQLQQQLDEQFVEHLKRIQQKYFLLSKHLQIRIQTWVEKLMEYDQNIAERKNRNNYIKLLKHMTENTNITHPFDKLPPDLLPYLHDLELRFAINNKQNPTHFFNKKKQSEKTKLIPPSGDNFCIATPAWQTQREETKNFNGQNFSGILGNQQNQSSNCDPTLARYPFNKNKYQSILADTLKFLMKKKKILSQNQQYRGLVQDLTKLLRNRDEQSVQLMIQQGIQRNRMNLFTTGSMEGTSQMQYFRDSLSE